VFEDESANYCEARHETTFDEWRRAVRMGGWQRIRGTISEDIEAEPTEIETESRADQLRWTKYALVASFVTTSTFVAGWLAILSFGRFW
jgi:hypothetical protein